MGDLLSGGWRGGNMYINFMMVQTIINPRRMHEGYGSHSMCTCVCVCVCVCVCYRANWYIHVPRLYAGNKVLVGFLWRFQHMHCVPFVENALFKSSGDIC